MISLFLILIFLVFDWLSNIFSDLCGNEIYKEVYSPNNKHKAIIFQRDCGATTGFSTQISVIDSSKSLNNDSGNIYVASGHPNQSNLQIKWSSNDTLVVINHNSATQMKEATAKGISIVYE